jgi:hypothetical protein
MDIRPYSVSSLRGRKNVYKFVSSGSRKVSKVVEFVETDSPGVYNLSLGDVWLTGEISYSNITNNKDTDRVMQTVAHIVQVFTKSNPERYVFVQGNTPVKTRLYQIYLSNNLEKVQQQFNVWGGKGDGTGFEVFKKGINYVAFLVKRV